MPEINLMSAMIGFCFGGMFAAILMIAIEAFEPKPNKIMCNVKPLSDEDFLFSDCNGNPYDIDQLTRFEKKNAKAERYETAALYRDKIKELRGKGKINPDDVTIIVTNECETK